MTSGTLFLSKVQHFMFPIASEKGYHIFFFLEARVFFLITKNSVDPVQGVNQTLPILFHLLNNCKLLSYLLNYPM